MKKLKVTSGGKAEAAGGDYETRVGVWYCVRVLLGTSAQPLYGLPASTRMTGVAFQTTAPVDDVNLVTSDDGYVFIQAKRTVQLSPAKNSPLWKSLDQFVRQFKACKERTGGHRWARPLDPDKDRLVLATRSLSSKKIHEVLPRLLRGVRDDTSADSLLDVAMSEEERQVAKTVDGSLRKIWKLHFKRAIKNGELGTLLRLIWVQVADVEDNQRDTITALGELRTSVLLDPSQAATAFAALVKLCGRLRADRSKTDYGVLQNYLVAEGISLNALPDYRKDIEALKKWTADKLRRYGRYTRLLDARPDTALQREVSPSLVTAALDGSFVLVGDPGAGKSGLMHDLASQLLADGHDAVFLPVELLSVNRPSEIQAELALSHPLSEVLENWPGKTGVLIVDALDAARKFETQTALRDVIDSVLALSGGRWNVVASIRRYDLRQGREWARMFAGRPPVSTNMDREFAAVKHVAVTALTDAEINQSSGPIPELAALFAKSSPELKLLLRNIFNLHLLAELLAKGVVSSQLAAIRTQPELLATYWDHRIVDSDGHHDGRETVLRIAVQEMIESKSLRAARAAVVAKSSARSLVELEQRDILRQEELVSGAINQDFLLFAHHIMFDYAAARLVLGRGRDPDKIVDVLRADRSLAVMLSPSLTMAMAESWSLGPPRKEFWTLAFKLAEEKTLPAIAQLLAPSIAAEFALDVKDFDPLLAAYSGSASDSANNIVQNLIGALFVRQLHGAKLVGVGAGPWMELIDALSSIKADAPIFAISRLIASGAEMAAQLTPGQAKSIGSASRNLLDFAWGRSPRHGGLVVAGITAVAETFATDADESARLLRRVIEPDHLKEYGHEEFHWLCRQIKPIAASDINLVVDIYEAGYGFSEESTDTTRMGNSSILSLTSNRRQDYEMSWYSLSQAMSHLLEEHEVEATRAIARAIKGYSSRERSQPEKLTTKTFVAGSKKYQFTDDLSHIWFRGGFQEPKDAPVLVKEFEKYLSTLASQKGAGLRFGHIVVEVGNQGGYAVLWGSLFAAGASHPKVFAKQLADVASSPKIMLSPDTRFLLGKFLTAAYGVFSRKEREAIEKSILSLKGTYGSRNKAILANCLPPKLVSSAAMKTYLKSQKDKPQNRAPSTFESSVSAYDTDAYLKSKGIDTQKGPQGVLRAEMKKAQELPQENQGADITARTIKERLPVLSGLRSAITTARKAGVEVEMLEHAEGILAERIMPLTLAPEKIFRAASLAADIQSLLQFTAKSNHPSYSEEGEKSFAKHRSWGGPSARLTSASAMIYLAAKKPNKDLSRALHALARDKVASVRYQVIQHLSFIYRSDSDWVWAEIERVIAKDPNEGVVCGALHALGNIAGQDLPRSVKLAKKVLSRFASEDDETGDKCESMAASLIADIAIHSDEPEAIKFFSGLVSNVRENSKLLRRLTARYSDQLRAGSSSNTADKKSAARKRVIGLYRSLVDNALAAMSDIAAGRSLDSFGQWSVEDQAAYREMIRTLEEVATRLYFASGAKDTGQTVERSAEQDRLYRESVDILEKLAAAGFVPITHHLVQTLEAFIEIEPANVFRLIAMAVKASESHGYGFESLAMTIVVRIIQRYLADHRDIFADKDRLNDLMDCLDVFVKAGWSAAQSLVFRLSDIWR